MIGPITDLPPFLTNWIAVLRAARKLTIPMMQRTVTVTAYAVTGVLKMDESRYENGMAAQPNKSCIRKQNQMQWLNGLEKI